jgi:hypothetical protein
MYTHANYFKEAIYSTKKDKFAVKNHCAETLNSFAETYTTFWPRYVPVLSPHPQIYMHSFPLPPLANLFRIAS